MSNSSRITSLLKRIASALALHAKQNEESLSAALDELVKLASQEGIKQKCLGKGYALVLGGRMATSDACTLLSALLPQTPLAVRPVLLTLSCLGEVPHDRPQGDGKVDYKVQRRALEQLAALLELNAVGKEGKEVLDRLYGTLERGLQYKTLRDPTASILCQITRRHHVQLHRIQTLQELIHRLVSPSSSLFRLLEQYRSFQPEQVYQQRGRGRGGDRSKVLEKWKEQARTILEGGDEGKGPDAEGRETKRRKTTSKTYIPLSTTYSNDLPPPSSIPLSDITSLAGLSSRIDTVALPSQAASILSSVQGSAQPPLVQTEEDRCQAWAVLLRCGFEQDPEHVFRLAKWLIAHLQHELYDLEPSTEGSARVEDLLCRARELSEIGGELIEDVEPFLAEYLVGWDGQAHRRTIFDLIGLLKPLEWDDLYSHFLRHPDRIASTASAEWVADAVLCLTSLVSNWALRDCWDEDASTATVFGRLNQGGPYIVALQNILSLGDRVVCTATRRYPTSLILRSSALSFYETALALPLEHNLPVTILPSSLFVYTSLLSCEVMSVSRICGIIAKTRDALTGASSAISKEDSAHSDVVSDLNRRLIDFVNALWQKKFLSTQGNGEAMDLASDDLHALQAVGEGRQQIAAASQGLTIHAALAPLARACFEALSEKDGKSAVALVGPVSASSLKALSKNPISLQLSFNDFRPAFLEQLHAQGAEGIHDFLFTSLQSLINRRALVGGPGASLEGMGSQSQSQ
ncbi:hypothetical protein JCM11641_001684 [Rhodosporidiobolus odoratus]